MESKLRYHEKTLRELLEESCRLQAIEGFEIDGKQVVIRHEGEQIRLGPTRAKWYVIGMLHAMRAAPNLPHRDRG